MLLITANSLGKKTKHIESYQDQYRKADEMALLITNRITTMLSYWDKNLVCIYANEAYIEWFGKAEEEIIGLPLQELIQVDDQSMSFIQKALDGEKVVFERDFSPHGTNRYTLVTYYPDIEDGEVKGFISHINDITAQKEKEIALTASELKFRSILESAPDAIVIADSYGIIRLINSRSEEMFQYTKEELVGQPVELLMPERFRNTHPQKRDSFSSNPHSRPMGNLILFGLRKNGEEFPVDVSISPLKTDEGMLTSAAFRDISWKVEKENESKQLEKEKDETAQRFTAIVQNGSDLIFIIDENNIPTYLSPSVYNHLGYTPEFLYNSSVVDFIHKKDYAKLILIAQASGDKEVQLPPIRIKHADGSWRWIEATIDNLFDNPAVQGLVLNAKDITDRKKRETERELMVKELTRSNNDLKQFSFITSHNLRAPLSNITGLLSVLDHESLDSGNKEILEMVDKAAQQLKNTIDDITEIVVIKNTIDTPLSAVDVKKMFNRVNKNFLNTENDIAAQISQDFTVNEIRFNKTYFESIFINLISNAIKYREAGTTLKIQVSTHLNEEGKAVLVFSDNGIGIDLSRHKDRIFGMYQRFHTHIDGQGLGLFIVKTQIEALGGKIEVESELHKGTKFIITFP